VRHALQRVNGRLILVEPKTSLSRRTVPVPEPTLAALRARRKRQNAERLAAGTAWVDSGLVFSTRLGKPLEPRNVNRSWYAARARAGLGAVRLHDLRHSCASFLLAAGASPRTVMKTLGHSQIGLDDEYLHSCAARDRARRRGRRSRNDLRCRLSRDPADAVGCKTWLHDLHTTEAEIRESAVELGAGEGNRTPDLRFTRPPLCLLSYTGTGSAIVADSVSRRAYRGGGRPRTERCRPRRPRSATPRSRSVSGRAGRIARRPPGTGPCLLSRRRARAGFR
jgi:hypothetical protein